MVIAENRARIAVPLILALAITFCGRSDVRAEPGDTVIKVDGQEIPVSIPVTHAGKDLLLPLRSIANSMGSTVEFDVGSKLLTVHRAQDASTAVYNTATGELSVNGIASGTIIPEVPGIFNAAQVSVPPDLVAVLLGVTVRKLAGQIEINRGELQSAQIVKPGVNWKDFGLDFLQGEIGQFSVKLNPQIQGQPTQYSIVENAYSGAGGHWGPVTYTGGCRVQGGTDGKFLTFNSANLNVRNSAAGWKFLGGDNPLQNYQGRQLNGYPVRGAQFYVPHRKWSFSKFIGAGFTKGVPVGGGTVRLSYQRFMSINEACYRPSKNFRGSVSTTFFKDYSPFVNNTVQHGYYVHSSSTYTGKNTNIFTEGFLGQARRTEKAQGTAYFLDVLAQRRINKRLAIFAEYDRINPNFSHPQIGNSMVNRQDVIAGTNIDLCSKVKTSCNYSFNQSLLDAKKPSMLQIVNSSFNFLPFGETGPNINLLATQTFFAPAITGIPAADSASKPSKNTLGTITIDHTLLKTHFSGGATTSVVSTKGAFKPTLSNSINLTANRSLGRLGEIQVLSQIGIFTTRTSTKTFDIRAIYKTRPLLFNTGLLFGSGYSRAGDFQRYTFITSLATNLPGLGAYSMNVSRQLAQTNSAGKLVRTVYLNKGRGRSELESAANGKPPPFGSIVGTVFETAVMPPPVPGKTARVEGIKVLLDGQEGICRFSDRNGRWVFTDIPAGRHKVAVSMMSTPATLTIVTAPSYIVQVLPGQETTVNFALAKLASVAGVIQVAPDAVSKLSSELTGGIRLYIQEKDFDTLSNGNGTFSLTDLPPGKYHVCIDKAFLAENVEVSPETVEVSLGSGQNLKGVSFQIREKERQIKKKVF